MGRSVGARINAERNADNGGLAWEVYGEADSIKAIHVIVSAQLVLRNPL